MGGRGARRQSTRRLNSWIYRLIFNNLLERLLKCRNSGHLGPSERDGSRESRNKRCFRSKNRRKWICLSRGWLRRSRGDSGVFPQSQIQRGRPLMAISIGRGSRQNRRLITHTARACIPECRISGIRRNVGNGFDGRLDLDRSRRTFRLAVLGGRSVTAR